MKKSIRSYAAIDIQRFLRGSIARKRMKRNGIIPVTVSPTRRIRDPNSEFRESGNPTNHKGISSDGRVNAIGMCYRYDTVLECFVLLI